LAVSALLSIATLYTFLAPESPINPKTRIKTRGNAKPKTTAEGLLKIARKLALVIANIAVNWLYRFMKRLFNGAKLLEKK
jgi:hypothetical protein